MLFDFMPQAASVKTFVRRAFSCFSAFVLFVGSMPASLAARADSASSDDASLHAPMCGLEESAPVTETVRVWDYKPSLHTHTPKCYNEKQELTCGIYEKDYFHTHNEWCYDENGELCCGLEERKPHAHTDACYKAEPVLICKVPESAGHTHTDACYTAHRELTCGKEEEEPHTHGDSCYVSERVLSCSVPESAGHIHTDACYAVREEKSLSCGLAESDPVYAEDGSQLHEGHKHSDACYTVSSVRELVCATPESAGHTHTDACYTVNRKLVCSKKETDGHTHTDACYTTVKELTCKTPESAGHTHGKECYKDELKLVCVKPTNHKHTKECYAADGKTVICGKLEVQMIVSDASCWKEEVRVVSEGHTHTEECYASAQATASESAPEAPADDPVPDEPVALPDVTLDETEDMKSEEVEEAELLTEDEETVSPSDSEPSAPSEVSDPDETPAGEAIGAEVVPAHTSETEDPVETHSDSSIVSDPAEENPAQTVDPAPAAPDVLTDENTVVSGNSEESLEVASVPGENIPEEETHEMDPVQADELPETEEETPEIGESAPREDLLALDEMVSETEEKSVTYTVTEGSVPEGDDLTGILENEPSDLLTVSVVSTRGKGLSLVRSDSDSFSIPENAVLLEAWVADGLKGNTQGEMTAQLNVVPALKPDEYLALYQITGKNKNHLSLSTNTLARDMEAGYSINMPLTAKGSSGIYGIALVKMREAYEDQLSISPEDYSGMFTVTGKLPKNAVVEVVPVDVSIDWENVLSAYEIRVYANANQQKKGKTWKPAEDRVKVEIKDDAFASRGLNIYHLADASSEAELSDTVTAQNGLVSFESDCAGIYVISETIEVFSPEATDGSVYEITVSYGKESGIPAGAALSVSEILPGTEAYDSYVAESLQKTGMASDELDFAHVFDISLTDPATGLEVEPSADVSVSVRLLSETLTENFRVDVVHFGDAAEVLPSVIQGDSIDFTSGGFSVYVVTGHTIEKILEASDGNTYKITVSYDAEAGIPSDAELVVNEVPETDMASYLEKAAGALSADIHHVSYGKLFDISIVKDGVEYQPNTAVSVTVELMDSVSPSDIRVVHFENENTAAPVDSVSDGSTVSFKTDGFSVFSFLDFSLLDQVLTAVLGETTGTLYENDEIILSGSMPSTGIVEAERVEASVDGERALVAYDIHIYAGPVMKLLGITWQPSEDRIRVTLKSDVLSAELVDVYHAETADAAPEVVAEEVAVDQGTVSFDASAFSVYMVTETVLEKTVSTSDGLTYHIQVTYPHTSGIPMRGTELLVSESELEAYVDASAEKLGMSTEDFALSRAFDIKIVDERDPSVIYEPKGDVEVAITLSGSNLARFENVDVLHFAYDDVSGKVDEMASSVYGDTVAFTTDGFSVYVVIGHEGGEVITPRVEFHFIDRLSDEAYINGVTSPFTASPYNFVNKAGTYQTSQIVKDGETLEMITDPRNIQIYVENDNDIEKFFYGWYAVNMTADTSALNAGTGRYTGSITYTWPEVMRVDYTDVLELSAEDTDGSGVVNVGDTLSWQIGDAHGSGAISEDGLVHVYLAPLFQDFYFVNFRMGVKEDPNGLSLNLLTRKLVVFGDQDTAKLRIGDVVCPSVDPEHKIFVGWETVREVPGGLARDKFFQTMGFDAIEINKTVDEQGNEIASAGNGYYITVRKTSSEVTQMNLFPVFAEARWLHFSTGKAGNGARYIPSAYLVSNDENEGTYFDNAFFNGTDGNSSHISARAGYNLEGWYAFANTDEDGNITNLTTPEPVQVSYIDETGAKQRVTINTTAVKIVDIDNTGATPVADVYYDGAYMLDTGSEQVKLFDVVDGKLYTYKALDDLTLYANWVPYVYTTYRVIVWKQKITDDKTTADADKTYDYEIFYTSALVPSNQIPNLTNFSGSYIDGDGNTVNVRNINLQNRAYTGFYYSRNDVGNRLPATDGTSVYNVYYDRNIMAINMYFRNTLSNIPENATDAYVYTQTTGNNTPQYGLVGDHFVELRRSGTANNYTWSIPVHEYTWVRNNNGIYGLVNGEHVRLTPVYNTTTRTIDAYRLTSTLSSGNDYLIVSSDDAGNAYALGHSGTSIDEDAVEIHPASGSATAVWIDAEDVDSTSVWRVGSGYTFKNGNYYISYNRGLAIRTQNNTDWSWSSGNNRLYTSSGWYDYYLRYYNNTFSASTSYNSIYLYEKTTVTVEDSVLAGYTYDADGVATPYEGDRYSYEYLPTGEYIPYNGMRFTRTAKTGYYMITWTGLYGQTFGQTGYSWDDVSGWAWYIGTTGSGTRQTFLDAFVQEENPYNMTTSADASTTSAIYHYRQQLNGLYSTEDRETAYGSGGTFTFSNKFEGFTVSTYSTGANGFSENGGTRAATGSSSTYPLHIYHTRDKFTLTFDINYPVDASLDYSNGKSETMPVDDIYFEAPLNEYGYTTTGSGLNQVTHWYYGLVNDTNTAEYPLVGPDHHTFDGWYEDASGTVPFNFNSTMPNANKIVYAKWSPEKFRIQVDPNGGEIDRIDHTGVSYTSAGITPFNRGVLYKRDAASGEIVYENGLPVVERPADTGYFKAQSTYFNGTYNEMVGEYALRARKYVPLSDAAATTYKGNVYYYVKFLYRETDGSKLPNDLHSAIYVTEDEIHDLYMFYRQLTQYELNKGEIVGTQILDEDTWRQVYVSQQKYRIISDNENWVFLGWFKVENGVMESMPYNFSDPIRDEFTLRAMWRMDGGYTIQYVAEYIMEDGAVINGGMEAWTDPNTTSGLAYSDGAATNIYKAPTDLTKNGLVITDDSVIFHGFRLVFNVGSDERPVYKAVEVDESGNVSKYYFPEEAYTVYAANADTQGRIILQAVYQYKESSDRRPEVTNLTLDANTGYIPTTDSTELPAWVYPGVQAVNMETALVGGNPTQILFGDIQSETSVHLYKYATDPGVIASDGKRFFVHPNNYALLGFDESPTEGDFIATYAANAVIAVDRADDQTLYAVWEPMVYVTFVNNTGIDAHDVTFALSSSSSDTLQVVTVREGRFDRRALSNLGSITLRNGESISLAFPYGEEKSLTVSGVNNLGVGKVLTWDSSIQLAPDNTLYDTMPEGGDVEYPHTTSSAHTHLLPHGEANNTKAFSFDETMIFNENPLIVTFTSHDNEYALIFDDNYPGGSTQEFDYSAAQIQTGSQALPDAMSRIGYEFQGWAFNPNATVPDYTVPGSIDDLSRDTGIFSTGTTSNGDTIIRTLYAVWVASSKAGEVMVYKEVPAPGNQTQDFTFTVGITGTFSAGYYNSYPIDVSDTFRLKHGWHLKITSTSDNASVSGHTTAYVQSVVQVFDENNVQQGQDVTVRWSRNVSVSSRNTFGDDLRFTVTESPAAYYATSVTRISQTSANYLYLGNSSNTYTLPLTISPARSVYWTGISAGGTVIFTNTRETYDVEVSKSLEGAGTAALFGFTASYVDGETNVVLDPFTVQSGFSHTLEDIPAGVRLTIQENQDENDYYDTFVSVDGRAETTGKSSGAVTIGLNPADAANRRHTVAFRNVLKTFPVTFRLVDQDGNPSINGMFSLASSVGTIGNDLYASAESVTPPPGVFYSSSEFKAGVYTLTQTVIPSGYIGPSGPLTVSVTGNGIICDDPSVSVTGDAEHGYVVNVINRATKVVTIRKILADSMLSNTRAFGFSASYTPQGSTIPVTRNFTLAPIANDPAGAIYELTVPIYASVTVTELTTGSYASVATTYDTTCSVNGGQATTGTVGTIASVSANSSVSFTNTRVTAPVTVIKEVDDPLTGNAGSFAFTARLKYGVNMLDYDDNGFTDGVYASAITLADGDSITFTAPVGANLIVSETVDPDLYNTTSAVTGGRVNEFTDLGSGFSMTIPGGTSEVTVTNARAFAAVTVAKEMVNGTSVDNAKKFDFTATLGGSYASLTALGFTNGSRTFSLGHGDTPVSLSVPAGASLTITESIAAADTGRYTTTATGTSGSYSNLSYTISSVPASGDEVVFTNTRGLAQVTVEKVLVDPLLSEGTFSFTGTLMDGAVNVTSGITSPSTLSAFTVTAATASASPYTHKGSVTFAIPTGTVLTLTEAVDSAYDVTATGILSAGSTVLTDLDTAGTNVFRTEITGDSIITFANTRKTVNVTVTKSLSDDQATGSVTFPFSAALTYSSAGVPAYTLKDNGGTGDIVTADGSGTEAAGLAGFTLSPSNAATDSVVVTVPYGADLTVSENVNAQAGDQTISDIYATTYACDSGAYVAGSSYTFTDLRTDHGIVFTNTRAASDLTITQTVSGEFADYLWPFPYTLTVENMSATASYSYTKYSSTDGVNWTPIPGGTGTLTQGNMGFALAHNQKIVIEGLPSTSRITASEENGRYLPSWDLTVGSDASHGTVNTATFLLPEDGVLEVNNHYPAVAPTEFTSTNLPFAIMLLVSVMICALLLMYRRRMRKEDCE